MPRLDAFDQEFGREPVAIVRGQRRKKRVWPWALVCMALGAGVIGALALGWPSGDGPLRFELQSAPPFQRSATREDADEQVDRLRREVDALRKEITELNETQRQAYETIATLKEDSRSDTPSAYWYSNLASLHFKVVRYADPRVAVPPPPAAPDSRDATTSSIQTDPRAATPAPRRARREPREPARGSNGGNGGGPLSLEAPQ